MISDGEDKEKLIKKAKELDIYASVSFLGLRDDISELLGSFYIFLFPSLSEGLSLSLVESQCTNY